MPIHIENYLHEINLWPMIVEYMHDHAEKYHITADADEQQVLKVIKKLAKKNLSPAKEYDTFRHAISNLQEGKKSSTLSRENIYRLFFTLELHNDMVAQIFCVKYLNQNELSARSLDEFIIICSLRLKLSWEETKSLRCTYRDKLHDYQIAPMQLTEHMTDTLYQDVILQQIKTKKELINWLNNNENLNFFAITRNKHYFALFNDIDWLSFTRQPLTSTTTIKLYEIPLSLSRLTKEKATISMRSYFQILFGLHSVEDTDDIPPESFLTNEEIEILASRYPSIFLTYETFCDLVQRRRKVDISSGTYIIRMLEEIDPNPDSDTEYVNFADKKCFLNTCNDYLLDAGFPILKSNKSEKPNNIFNTLILDIYEEVLEENPKASSIETKEIFFEKLRYYFKKIAALQQT